MRDVITITNLQRCIRHAFYLMVIDWAVIDGLAMTGDTVDILCLQVLIINKPSNHIAMRSTHPSIHQREVLYISLFLRENLTDILPVCFIIFISFKC